MGFRRDSQGDTSESPGFSRGEEVKMFSRATSAAPVSSTQPRPASAATSRAASEISEPTITSGRFLRSRTSWTSRRPALPTQRSLSRLNPTRSSVSGPFVPATLSFAERGSTARNAASNRGDRPSLCGALYIGYKDSSLQHRGILFYRTIPVGHPGSLAGLTVHQGHSGIYSDTGR